MNSDLKTMLDALGSSDGSRDAAPPPAFIGRVRRRRAARVATRLAAGVLVLAMFASVFLINRPGAAPADGPGKVPTYAAVEWPPLPEGHTGGPVMPIRAGMRLDDPLAASLLQ